jgi:hypothetical protein
MCTKSRSGPADSCRGTHIDTIFNEWLQAEDELVRGELVIPPKDKPRPNYGWQGPLNELSVEEHTALRPGYAAQAIADLLMSMVELEPYSMEHLLMERAVVDEDISHIADVNAKSDCEFYMTGFNLINTVVKKLTGKELLMDVRDSEIHSIKVKE